MFWAAAAYVALSILGFWLFVPGIETWLRALGVQRVFGASLGTTVFVIAWVFLSGALFVGLAGWFSSLLWDRLSLEIEKLEGVDASGKGPGCLVLTMDTVARLAFSGAVVLMGFVLGFFTFGIASILLCGWIGLLDFTACACLRRGIMLTGQVGKCSGLPGATGFAIAVGILSMFPLVNVVLLPGLVAGGTLLILDAEKKGRLAR